MAKMFNLDKNLEIITSTDGFPQLRIPCIDIDGYGDRKEHDYYLSPFRGYRFQISGNERGGYDYASTPVIGLGNVVRACRGYEAPVGSRSSIYSSNFSSIVEGIFELAIDACIGKFNTENSFLYRNANTIMPEFTQRCIDYVSSLVERDLLREAGLEGEVKTVSDPELIEQLNKQFG